MDWVHCNMCFTQPGEVPGKNFSITNCGHIFCAECLRSGKLEECCVCHSKYDLKPLTSKLTPDIEPYFHDPVQNIQKQLKILEFQQGHRIRLLAFYKAKLNSYKTFKKEYVSIKEETKRLKQENETLLEETKRKTDELNHLRKKCETLMTYCQSKRQISTPVSHSTPHSGPRVAKSPRFSSGSENNFNAGQTVLKRPPQTNNSNFFIMSDAKASQKTEKLFATPNPPKYQGNYRNVLQTTPLGNSPQSPESFASGYSQKDPLQRKIKLPGDRGGPSPLSRIGLQALSLSRPSKSKKESPAINKYSKYF